MAGHLAGAAAEVEPQAEHCVGYKIVKILDIDTHVCTQRYKQDSAPVAQQAAARVSMGATMRKVMVCSQASSRLAMARTRRLAASRSSSRSRPGHVGREGDMVRRTRV